MSDTDSVLRSLAGDRDAYGELVNAYQARVFAIALSITGNYSDSEDITQEVFLKAYQKLRTLSNPSNFGKWFYTISKRLSISFLRRRNRIPRAAIDGSPLRHVTSNAESADEAYARKEFSSLVLKEVNTLPQKLREAIFLYYMEGFSIKDAASFLGINENAMKKRLHYGRTRIRENLTEQIEAELRQYQPSRRTRGAILAALPASGVPPRPALSDHSPQEAIPVTIKLHRITAIIERFINPDLCFDSLIPCPRIFRLTLNQKRSLQAGNGNYNRDPEKNTKRCHCNSNAFDQFSHLRQNIR